MIFISEKRLNIEKISALKINVIFIVLLIGLIDFFQKITYCSQIAFNSLKFIEFFIVAQRLAFGL